MDVTLRKAAALASQASEASQKIVLKRSISVSIYDETPIANLAETATGSVKADIAKAVGLVEAAYQIRTLIASANQASGISDILTARASAETVEKLYLGIQGAQQSRRAYGITSTGATPIIAERERSTIIERLNTGTLSTMVQQAIEVTLIDDEFMAEITDALDSIRRKKVEMADRLSELNHSTRIVLPIEVEAVLIQYGVL